MLECSCGCLAKTKNNFPFEMYWFFSLCVSDQGPGAVSWKNVLSSKLASLDLSCNLNMPDFKNGQDLVSLKDAVFGEKMKRLSAQQ